MTNSKLVLAVGLAATTLVAVLPFFAGGVLLLLPWSAPLVVQAGLAPVFGISAVALLTAAFVILWNQRSFLVAGLLAASGILFMIPAVIATGYFAVIVVPGHIVGVIIGLGIFGLGVVKGIRTAKTAVVTVR